MPAQSGLPTGTVTFLFTDIEGSTRMWEAQPRAMQAAVARHDALLREAIESNGGYVFKTVGDAFCAAFPTAPQALDAALACQFAVQAAEWDGTDPIKVRMALHTGSAEMRDNDYFGLPLNRVARLLSTGHGGQILLSLATQQLVRDHLPPGVTLKDLGTGGLKDLVRAEHLYQVVAPGLPSEFPPLKSLDDHYIDPDTRAGTGPQRHNPYKGLRAFHEVDAPDFFGREILTQRLVERLAEVGSLSRFLAVVGPSGSGKSSVVRAGLVPALRQGNLPGSERWLIVEMLPGPHPLEELDAVLLSITANPVETVMGLLKEDERGLIRAAKRVLPRDESLELALVVDQFEEIFTLVEDEPVRVHFLQILCAAVSDPRSRVRVIVTLRADFFDRPLLYPDPGELMRQRTTVVLPLSAEELERAIIKPAQGVGVSLENNLVTAIVKDVGEQPGTLPLLQYAMTELFNHRVGKVMTLDAYRATGGVLGALAKRADSIYDGLSDQEQPIARQLFLRLITLGEGAEDTRRRARRSELLSIAHDATSNNNPVAGVIEVYGRYRLLTFDMDPVTKEPTVEVAHEALIRTWSRLRQWLDESRADLRVERQLMAATTEWRQSGKDPSYLPSGARLGYFEALALGEGNSGGVALTSEENEYLQVSTAERERQVNAEKARQAREQALQKRAASRLRYLVATLALFLVVATGLTFWALRQSQVAQANEQTARTSLSHVQALRLASDANNMALEYGENQLVALLAIRSMNTEYTPEADVTLSTAAMLSYPVRVFQGHSSGVRDVAFAPDGKHILTSGDDKTARVWDLATGKQVGTFSGHTYEVYTAAYSPDGKYVVTAGEDHTVRLWDADTTRLLHTFSGKQPFLSAAFSPDGKRLLAGSFDNVARIWDISSGIASGAWGPPVITFTGHTEGIVDVEFSPDGKNVLTSSVDKTARLWDAATGKPLRVFTGHADAIDVTAYSPDGKYVATGSCDSTARIWDAATGDLVRVLTGHRNCIEGIAFSPDGNYLLTGSLDGSIRLWSITTGQEVRHFTPGGTNRVAFSRDGNYFLSGSGLDSLAYLYSTQPVPGEIQLIGHTSSMWQSSFSKDGKRVLTAGQDGTARIWDAASGRELQRFDAHTSPPTGFLSAVFSPDEKYVLAADDKNTALVWDTHTAGLITTLAGFTDVVRMGAFSPDGKYAVTTSLDGTAHVWETVTWRNIVTFTRQMGNDPRNPMHVNRVMFSPDGKRVVTSGDDLTARIWDPFTGNELQVLRGHTALISGVGFSPDGNYVVTGSNDGTARLWDAATGIELRQFLGHTGAVLGAAFSPGGRFVLTTGKDRTARLWEVSTGREIRRFVGHNAAVRDAAFSPNGKYIVTAGEDGLARIWQTDYHDTIRSICSLLTRDLTAEERAQYNITDNAPTCPQP